MAKKHLTLNERYKIEDALNDGLSFRAIGFMINKSASSISREVKKNSTIVKSSGFNNSFNDCIHKRDCSYTHLCNNYCDKKCSSCSLCNKKCSDYTKDVCERLSTPPYVCNGCNSRRGCRKEKYIYKGKEAQENYEFLLKSSRKGINLTEEEFDFLKTIVPQAIKQGHSPAIIVMNNPNINRSESTIYRDIDRGLYENINNSDLPRKVKFKKRESKVNNEDTTRNTKNREGRTYEDMLIYKAQHPTAKLVQFDTVEGKKGGSASLLYTFQI